MSSNNLITIVVPYRPSSEERISNWNFLKNKLKKELYRLKVQGILEVDSPTQEWNKPLAIANGVLQVDTPYTAIMDSDVWIPGIRQVLSYVDRNKVPYVIPHHRTYRLNNQYSSWVKRNAIDLNNVISVTGARNLSEQAKKSMPGGGCVVVKTRILRNAVPFDPRHPSWGNEDHDWWIAARTMIGIPVDFRLSLIHLYHKPQFRVSRQFGSAQDELLHKKYKAAYMKKLLMEEILLQAGYEIKKIFPNW